MILVSLFISCYSNERYEPSQNFSQKGLDLSNALNSCGEFSGRSKAKYCLLTDIGK